MKILISQGDRLEVEVADSDGGFVIQYNVDGSEKLTVHADMPDTAGREGEIYCEDFGSRPEPAVTNIVFSTQLNTSAVT